MAKGLTHLAKCLRKRSTDKVVTNTSGVLKVIRERLYKAPSPQSPPLKGGEVFTHIKQERITIL